MDLGVQTLPYYLKVFNILIIILLTLIILSFYSIFIKTYDLNDKLFLIEKNQSIDSIITNNFKNISIYERYIFKIFYKFFIFNKNKIHYGEFNINEKTSVNKFLVKISKPSNIRRKITIIEGSNKYDLNIKLSEYFKEPSLISYNEILADTYYYSYSENFNDLHSKLKKFKTDFFNKNRNHILFKKFSDEEIIVIGSLIEKEGLDSLDKKKIFSVIKNRIEKKMRLQIDATVIYALTDGKYNLKRKLSIDDLKFKHPSNTYLINSLPPEAISYVGTKTIELMLENYNTEYLFYFFNESKKKHIFSTTYKEHTNKLNEYRKSK